MDARYKILFSGEFKDWVVKDEFIQAFCIHLGASEERAAALYEVDRKVNLKKNLSDAEADRHVAAFEKMGMLVSKKLMMKPFVGPRIELESKVERAGGESRQNKLEIGDKDWCSKFCPSVVEQGKRGWSSLTRGLKSLVNKSSS